MDLAGIISGSREYLSVFDYDHYPENFEAFGKSCSAFFDGLEDKDLSSEADALADELEKGKADLSRREAKTAAEEEKRVLALFFTPAALKRGGRAEEFANVLCDTWNRRYPKNAYKVGDYDTILKGFDSDFLGIKMRKSSRRQ